MLYKTISHQKKFGWPMPMKSMAMSITASDLLSLSIGRQHDNI